MVPDPKLRYQQLLFFAAKLTVSELFETLESLDVLLSSHTFAPSGWPIASLQANAASPVHVHACEYGCACIRHAPTHMFTTLVAYTFIKCLYHPPQAMDKELQVEDNKVKGCQSVVYVHATKDEEGKVFYTGESDSQLTKVK